MVANLATELQTAGPLVIAHRGACGYRPEHTLAAYELAIRQGADLIEPDLVATRDGVLVARHENEISGTTNVANHPEYAGRRTTKLIKGRPVTGWFTEDFTLAELKVLRAIERVPHLRPANTAYDSRFEIPTFGEILDLIHRMRGPSGTVGVCPEIKLPGYYASIGLQLEPLLAAELRARDLTRDASIFVQSFNARSLRLMADLVDVPLVQLVHTARQVAPRRLAEIASYARAIGAKKDLVIPRDVHRRLSRPTNLVRRAAESGLAVHVWTVRAENSFLPRQLQSDADPAAFGDVVSEHVAFLDAGVDGIIADHPDIAVHARSAWFGGRTEPSSAVLHAV